MMRHLLSASLTLLAISSPALADDGDAMVGKGLYDRYCATCHGLDGMGQGPMAAVLTLQPTDLTRLVAQNDGTFPYLRVIGRIDGRETLVSHGSPMPIFGDYFAGPEVMLKTETGQPVLSSQPIADLVAYLRVLQGGSE